MEFCWAVEHRGFYILSKRYSMKRIGVLLIFILLILSSCTGGETGLSRLHDTDGQTADKRLEQLLTAIEGKDKLTIKSMFSKKALSEVDDFDETVNSLFVFFDGQVQEKGKSYPAVYEKKEAGIHTKKLLWWNYVQTDKFKYVFIFIEHIENTEDPDILGLYTLRVIKEEDEDTLFTSYDDVEIPGIFVP